MLCLGGVLCLAILLWRTAPSLEWSIPPKWQVFIRTLLSRWRDKTDVLNYVCHLGSEDNELERDLWHLRMDLLRRHQKSMVKVRVHQEMATGQKKRYLACLQRRFPEIEIYECSLGEKKGQKGTN